MAIHIERDKRELIVHIPTLNIWETVLHLAHGFQERYQQEQRKGRIKPILDATNQVKPLIEK